ncbi:MAG TPA: metallopeptidase TldD-related protein [Gemmatimonadales bacterium]|nr:metallopeptidase TldD-related protein [Gemmatimonadales bacterium]
MNRGFWLLAFLPVLGPALRAQSDVVRRAMRDEMARSMTALHLDTMPAPYFISYRIDDVRHTGVSSSLGGLSESGQSRSRRLTVEVRIGSYAFDNTNYFGASGPAAFAALAGMGFGDAEEIPLDDDYLAIRRQLWLATDAAYKRALEELAGKRAALANTQARSDSLPDFAHATPAQTTDVRPDSVADRKAAEALARDLSATLMTYPDLQRSQVSILGVDVYTEYLNSEGTRFGRAVPWWQLTVTAGTQAADGMVLYRSFAVQAPSFSGLPARADALARAHRLGDDLERQRTDSVASIYHGPVLITGEAAAQVFARVFGAQLIARRSSVSSNPIFARMMGASLEDEIGSRVIARFLNISDDPTLTTVAGHYVGGYRVDDEGVTTRRTALVSHGILKSLLGTREPAKGAERSTGNNRGGAADISTMIVTADSGLSDSAMKKKLLALVSDRGASYGIIVRSIADGSLGFGGAMAMFANVVRGMNGLSLPLTDAVRVYPDGHEEPIRGGGLGDLTLASFRDLVAASDSSWTWTAPIPDMSGLPIQFAGLMDFAARRPPSSFVVPALLFEDLSIDAHQGDTPKPPVVPPPWVKAGNH